MMSIVSNTRVDIVARGVIKACLELGHDPAEKIAIFRIPGAWEEEGFKILEKYGDRATLRPLGVAVEKTGPPVTAPSPRSRARMASGRRHAMSILIDADTTFIVQGITGREAVNLTRECLDYGAGAKIVGGVTPGRLGRDVHGVPVFDTVAQAVAAPRRADRRLGRHGAPRVHQGCGLRGDRERRELIVIVTERIPRRDVAEMVELASLRGARIIGPNCLGIIVPGRDQDGRHRRPGEKRRLRPTRPGRSA